MQSFGDVWVNALAIIKENVSFTSYDSWISLLRPIKFENDKAFLYAQTNFQKQLIINKFRDEIQNALTQVMGFEIEAIILSEEDVSKKISNSRQIKDVQDIKIEEDSPERQSMSLNSDLTFENFVVGDENKFAHAAALAVANNPAGAYNPFFIYGKSGLGKTHLLFAIANEIRKNNPDATIMVVKGEEFTNELIQAIQNGQQTQFRNKYRYVDVFLVDDVQFIGGKVSTEMEFFHTFEALYEAKKQIIVTSDRPPKEMATLEERLRNRFESGLIADIQPPDLETRVAIIKSKAESLGIDIPSSLILFIAEKIKSNIRQLEGAVKKMKAYIELGEEANLATAQKAIRDIFSEGDPTPVLIDKIIDEVARTYGVTVADIKSKKHDAKFVFPRHVAMYIIREMTPLTNKKVAELFGLSDHSSVMYAYKKISTDKDSNYSLKTIITDIMKNVQSN